MYSLHRLIESAVLGTLTIITTVSALSIALPANADDAMADVTLEISQISELPGLIHWALFDSAEAFNESGVPVIAARSRVQSDTLSITLHDIPIGRYALRLFHDSNGNGELDRNIIGIPSEGYGFSNNAGGRGPADFDDAAVAVDRDTTITVRVR